MDANTFIQNAAHAEESSDLNSAYDIAVNGYVAYPNNYELIFMIGNYCFAMEEYEKAYVYHLLAEAICDDDEDLSIIASNRKIINTEILDVNYIQKLLSDVILERMKKHEYKKTYRFVTWLISSDENFLVEKVCDVWLRYAFIILEVKCLEENKDEGMAYMADWITNYAELEEIVRQFKFAYRRIWFGFSDDKQSYILNLIEQYQVSAEFLAVVGKYSVEEHYLFYVLSQISKMLAQSGNIKLSNAVMDYADKYGDNISIRPDIDDYDNNMEVITVDASVKASYKKEENIREPELISYILSANKECHIDEILLYLSRQRIPFDGRMTVYVIYNAPCIAAGYNIGMMLSSAPYKIYINHDVFIYDVNYTNKILNALQTSDYRLIGPAGIEQLSSLPELHNSLQENMHMCLTQDRVTGIKNAVTEEEDNCTIFDVEILDATLMATSEDICWRDNMFHESSFQGFSQSMEFRKKKYKTGVFFDDISGGGILCEANLSKTPETEIIYESEYKIFFEEYLSEAELDKSNTETGLMAVCVLTYNNPDVVEDVLKISIQDYTECGIDIYYYDGSDNIETKKVVEKFIQKGYTNLYYYHIYEEKNFEKRLDMIVYGYGLKKKYQYVWLTKDRAYCTRPKLNRVLESAQKGVDVIFLAFWSVKGPELWSYQDATLFYRDWAWLATSLDVTIYKSSTMFKCYVKDRYPREFGSHYTILFSRLAELDEVNIDVLVDKEATKNSSVAKIRWEKAVFKIWKDYWIVANNVLPECYEPYKAATIKRAAGLPWIFGGKDRLIDLHKKGVLVPESLDQIRVNWDKVSNIPFETVEKIANGMYIDAEHDLSNITSENQSLKLLIGTAQLVRSGDLNKERIPFENIEKILLNEIMGQNKYTESDLYLLKGSIESLKAIMDKYDLNQTEVGNIMQIFTMFLLLAVEK